MARSRNIKPGFFTNEDLAECSPWARLLFAGLWLLADREGRLEDRPRRIKAEIFPFDAVDVEAELTALAERRLIVRYEAFGARFVEVTNFTKHQQPHYKEVPSKIPPPRFAPDDAGSTPMAPDSQNEKPNGDADLGNVGSTSGQRRVNVDSTLTQRQVNQSAPCPSDSGFLIPDSGFLIPDSGKERARKRASATASPLRPPEVDEQTWSDWLALRRAKKAPVTKTVIAGAVAEANKAGMPLDAFLRLWCERGSQGLRAEWLRPAERGTGPPGASQQDPQWRKEQRERNEAFFGPYAARRQGETIDCEASNVTTDLLG